MPDPQPQDAESVVDVCSHGRPDHIELIYQLRDALGLHATAMPVPPKKVWEDTLEVVRRLAGTREVDRTDG